jgi:hypothetical protein
MPPKKASAPGAATLQPLDTNQETLSLQEARSHKRKPPVQHSRRRSWTKRSGIWKSSINKCKGRRRRWRGWPIFKGRSTKLLKKCVILLKMNKIEGPNTGSFIKQFLMSYEATISSYGGNTAVMAKSFVMAVRNVAQTWYSSLRPGTITSWQKLKDMLVTSFQGFQTKPVTAQALFQCTQDHEEYLQAYV